jgi:hypothetical protein
MRTNIIFLIALILAISALACPFWFDPFPSLGGDSQYGKVVLARVNTYETYQKTLSDTIFSTNASIMGVDFFDAGDRNNDITSQYGGDTNDTFACAWPVTFYIWFQTNSANLGQEYAYNRAMIQYFEGSNSLDSTEWNTIYTITNFSGVESVEGAHFGIVTWYPPKTNNTYYLVRVWAQLKSGAENASTNGINIDKDGNGNPFDWNDYEVMLIRVIPSMKPGSRSMSTNSKFMWRGRDGAEVLPRDRGYGQ